MIKETKTDLLRVGLVNRQEIVITEQMSAANVGSGLLPVYATPSMVAFMEKTCAECVEPFLKKGETTVGVSVNVKHLSATPIGLSVTCHCCLVEIDRRKLIFEVRCEDKYGKIGEGRHERFIVDSEYFLKKTMEKTEKSS